MSQDPSDVLMLRAQKLYDCLSEEACPDHVILDDRTYLSMGARVRDSERLGYPCTVIIGYKVRMCLYSQSFMPVGILVATMTRARARARARAKTLACVRCTL